jgi:hypothetical protein
MVLGHIWTETVDPKDKRVWMWWKVCSYMWTMIFWWNCIISIAFWSFMLPTEEWKTQFEGRRWLQAKLLCDHIIPLFFSLIDWFLNGIVYEKHHLLS